MKFNFYKDIFSQRFIFPFYAVCLLLCSSCQTWLKSPRMKSVSSKATLFPFSALHSVWPQWEWIFLYVEQPFGWSFPKWGWTKTACFRQTMNWGNQVWNNKDYFYLIHVKLLQQSLRIKYWVQIRRLAFNLQKVIIALWLLFSDRFTHNKIKKVYSHGAAKQ